MKPAYTKTAEDITQENYDLDNDAISVYLRHIEEQRFKPGDILVKMMLMTYGDDAGQWRTEVVSTTSGAPKKYLYAFENEFGVGYIKSFKTDGTLAKGVFSITNLSFNDTRFALDPEYADHLLLGGDEEFKPENSFKEKKRFRDKAINNNKKLLIPKESAAVIAWMDGLEVGDTFYSGWNVPTMIECKYRVLERKKVKVDRVDLWKQDSLKEKFGLNKTDTTTMIKAEIVKHVYHNVGNVQDWWPTDFINQAFTDKELFPLTDNQ